MRDAFFQALMVRPPKICGRQLLPFSLAHEYILRRLGSPFVCTGGDPVRREDVLLAVAVCSRTLAQNRELIAAGLGTARRLCAWGLDWRRVDVETAASSLRTYIDDYSEAPPHKTMERTDGKRRTIGAPIAFHVVRVLCRRFNCSLDEAWNMGKGYALALWDTENEANGDETLLSEAEQYVDDLCEMAQKARAEGDEPTAQAYEAQAQAFCHTRAAQ